MVKRAQAKAAFERARRERDLLEAAGDEVGAWKAHARSKQIVTDYRKGRR